MQQQKNYFMHKFSTQPCDDAGYTGKYCVVKWNSDADKWDYVKDEIYSSENEAKERAKQLNEQEK